MVSSSESLPIPKQPDVQELQMPTEEINNSDLKTDIAPQSSQGSPEQTGSVYDRLRQICGDDCDLSQPMTMADFDERVENYLNATPQSQAAEKESIELERNQPTDKSELHSPEPNNTEENLTSSIENFSAGIWLKNLGRHTSEHRGILTGVVASTALSIALSHLGGQPDQTILHHLPAVSGGIIPNLIGKDNWKDRLLHGTVGAVLGLGASWGFDNIGAGAQGIGLLESMRSRVLELSQIPMLSLIAHSKISSLANGAAGLADDIAAPLAKAAGGKISRRT